MLLAVCCRLLVWWYCVMMLLVDCLVFALCTLLVYGVLVCLLCVVVAGCCCGLWAVFAFLVVVRCCLVCVVCGCSFLSSSLLVCVFLVSFVLGVRCLSRNGVAWCSWLSAVCCSLCVAVGARCYYWFVRCCKCCV